MRLRTLLLSLVALLSAVGTAGAGERYATPPPVTLSPDLAGAWTLQLRQAPRAARKVRRARVTSRRASLRRPARRTKVRRTLRARTLRATPPTPPQVRQAALPSSLGGLRTADGGGFDPALEARVVNYLTDHKPGTIVVDTIERRLYLVMEDGLARRYGIGVGKPGFEWSGSHRVTRKAEWPGWTPPKEMIEREALKGRILPAHMPGGVDNPLGARALYLGSTLYRIHGTNQDWSIGHAVSSGCIRMRNSDVMDLYDRVKVGTKVHVI